MKELELAKNAATLNKVGKITLLFPISAKVSRYLRSKGAKTGSLNLNYNLIATSAPGDVEESTMTFASNDNISMMALDLSNSWSS